jgi:hypothetical protein
VLNVHRIRRDRDHRLSGALLGEDSPFEGVRDATRSAEESAGRHAGV